MRYANALIVDDSKLARVTLKRKLETFGLSVAMAESGQAALDYLLEAPVDIIFMDHLMPEMDGFQATQAIRQHDDISQVPVVMCTGKESEGYLEQAIAIGANQILSKPPADQDLEALLQTDFVVAASDVALQNEDISFSADHITSEPFVDGIELSALDINSGAGERSASDSLDIGTNVIGTSQGAESDVPISASLWVDEDLIESDSQSMDDANLAANDNKTELAAARKIDALEHQVESLSSLLSQQQSLLEQMHLSQAHQAQTEPTSSTSSVAVDESSIQALIELRFETLEQQINSRLSNLNVNDIADFDQQLEVKLAQTQQPIDESELQSSVELILAEQMIPFQKGLDQQITRLDDQWSAQLTQSLSGSQAGLREIKSSLAAMTKSVQDIEDLQAFLESQLEGIKSEQRQLSAQIPGPKVLALTAIILSSVALAISAFPLL